MGFRGLGSSFWGLDLGSGFMDVGLGVWGFGLTVGDLRQKVQGRAEHDLGFSLRFGV